MTSPRSQPVSGHTPTPWEKGNVYVMRDGICLATCGTGNWMPKVEEANAAFIVEAVNSYAANQERIRELEKALRIMVENFKPFTLKPVGSTNSPVRMQQEHQIEIYKAARAALDPGAPK